VPVVVVLWLFIAIDFSICTKKKKYMQRELEGVDQRVESGGESGDTTHPT
jgi:hypothetical protein